jgi:hypothetical protein
MATDIFRDPTKSLPKKDEQIVRVPFEQQDLGGRPSHMPGNPKSGQMGIQHVPNAGSKH